MGLFKFKFGKQELEPVTNTPELESQDDENLFPKDGEKLEDGVDVANIEEIYSLVAPTPKYDDKDKFGLEPSVSFQQDKHDFTYYQEKFELELFEMEELMKACADYDKSAKDSIDLKAYFKELEVPEDQVEKIVKDLAETYPDYLASLNEYGLPFSEEEIKLLSNEDKEKYLDVKTNLMYFDEYFNVDPVEGEERDKRLDNKDQVDYSRLFKALITLENKFRHQIRAVKRKEERKKENRFEDMEKPEYSEFDIEIQDLAYKKVIEGSAKPLEIKGRQLTDAEVAELALEAIERKLNSGELFKGNFKPGKKKDQLVLKRTLSFKNGKNFRDILYISQGDQDLKPGQHIFELDLDSMKVLNLKKGEKIDQEKYNIAIANVNIIDVRALKDLVAARAIKKDKEDKK